jgi:hypothetical protein
MGTTSVNIRCQSCNASINAFGKAVPTSNNCTCISNVLIFNSSLGACDCGPTRVLIVQGATNFLCVPCSNASIYLGAKNATSGRCNCLSPNLVWDPSVGLCTCSNPLQVIAGNGANAACFFCRGPYVATVANYYGCNCIGSGMAYTATLSTMTCRCPAFNFIAPNMTCLRCPTGTTSLLTDFECRCATGSIWNNLLNICQRCGAGGIADSTATRATALACGCTGGKVWDVMTNTCINVCSPAAASCMACGGLPGTTG